MNNDCKVSKSHKLIGLLMRLRGEVGGSADSEKDNDINFRFSYVDHRASHLNATPKRTKITSNWRDGKTKYK